MYIDILFIFFIKETPVTFRDDCETFNDTRAAYHIVTEHTHDDIVTHDTHINLCPRGYHYKTVVHEIGHELHHRILQDESYRKYIQVFEILHNISNDSSDYISKYAEQNLNEDFAETFREYYSRQYFIPEINLEEEGWINDNVSEIQHTKFRVMDLIVKKYLKSMQ